jgi:hypothetical protein
MRLYRTPIAPSIVNRRAVPEQTYLTIHNQQFATDYLVGAHQNNVTRCSQRELHAVRQWLMHPVTAVYSAIN